MLKRRFIEKLINWKKREKKKALLIKGARQIGKTFIVREFGKKYYKSFIELNLYENKDLINIFNESLDVDSLKREISIRVPNAKFIDGNTLIFIDEIEFAPNARTALKFIVEDGRYDVIATGSLLSINYKDITSIPVGYEEHINMYSLDFEEFLWAKGFQSSIDIIHEYFEKKEKIPYSINMQLMGLLREYAVVGGMPEIVDNYIKTNDFNIVFDLQTNILNSIKDDIIKYAETKEKPKVKNCFLSIPYQLSKENKKFMFSKIEHHGTRSKYTNSIEWLRDANIVKICYNLSESSFPIRGYIDFDYFKVYMSDIGLLSCMYGKEIRKTIIDNTLRGNIKGAIYENLIADILSKRDEDLFYYKNSLNTQEIEFLLERDSSIVPVEVKSGNNRTISLNNILEDDNVKYGYKLIDGNIGTDGKKITLPLYMALFI